MVFVLEVEEEPLPVPVALSDPIKIHLPAFNSSPFLQVLQSSLVASQVKQALVVLQQRSPVKVYPVLHSEALAKSHGHCLTPLFVQA